MLWVYIGAGLLLVAVCFAGMLAFGQATWKPAYIFQAYFWPKYDRGVIEPPKGFVGAWRGWYRDGLLMFVVHAQYSGSDYICVNEEYWPSGRLAKQNTTINGVLEGPYEHRYENGQISCVGNFHKDRFVGQEIRFFESGAKKSEGDFSAEGGRSGLWTEYWPNGVKRSEGRYRMAAREGRWVFYHSNGRKSEEGAYVLAVRESGERFVPYNENGATPKGSLIMGLRNVVWRSWDESGRLNLEERWECGSSVPAVEAQDAVSGSEAEQKAKDEGVGEKRGD